MHEWMLDNGFTPHIVVDATRPGVRAPESHVKDGKIVLNISPAATRALTLGNDAVTFETRFNGVPLELVIPTAAVLGIYARETGQSVVFGEEAAAPPPDGDEPPPAPPAGGKQRAKLKVVK